MTLASVRTSSSESFVRSLPHEHAVRIIRPEPAVHPGSRQRVAYRRLGAQVIVGAPRPRARLGALSRA